MTAEKYVNNITKKIKCSKKKRIEIKQQLLSDISAELENGEVLENVLKRIGSVEEVAKEFNQNLSEAEERAYKKQKKITILSGAAFIIIVVIAAVYWFFPKVASLEEGGSFEKAVVEEQVKTVIQELDENQFEALRGHAIEQIQELLVEDTFIPIKEQLGEDWGERQSIGTIYMAEVKQQGQLFVVAQAVVGYKNINVTYTITFDKDMNLAGLYIK